MDFGKRVSIREPRTASALVAQRTCVRCSGTGWIRERGGQITCKACKGSGKVAAKVDRAS
jgi:DnaJ-class molecular chaperone